MMTKAGIKVQSDCNHLIIKYLTYYTLHKN